MPTIRHAVVTALKQRHPGIALACMASAVSASTLVSAQAAGEPDASRQLEEVVVTGTFIRGIQPTGSQVIGLSEADVIATGATSGNDLLASVPQVTNYFNAMPTVNPDTANQLQVVRPNLRNLPGGNTASGAATLVLVDGHRVPGVGVDQVAPDPDMVPPAIIERVEIITDGGSSIYGADAIGGVINFITRKRYEGMEVSAGYATADDYMTYDISATAGTAWDSGSTYISYTYADRDEVLVGDRSYAKDINWETGQPSGRECAPANVNVFRGFAATSYAMPGLQANTVNACDPSQLGALYPAEDRQSVFAGFTQTLGDRIDLEIRANYSERDTTGVSGPQGSTVNINSGNPYYRDVGGTDAGMPQSVAFSYGPYTGNRGRSSETGFEVWGITPTLTVDITEDWVLRVLANYGKSETAFTVPSTNSALVNEYGAGTTLETAINPYDIASTANTQLIDNILDWEIAGDAEDEIINARAIADGPLFSIPGGEVRAAIGVEYMDETFKQRKGDVVRGGLGAVPRLEYSRDVESFFGELQVPIIGDNNRLPGVHSLTLSAAARHDKYSDFGSTTNPKIGLNYQPADWLTLRGNWGESFNAPTPVDQLLSSFNSLIIQNFFTVAPPGGEPAPAGSWAIALTGADNDLQPQEAVTWSVGFDIEPPALSGLRASVNYYVIEFEGTLGRAPVFNAQQLYDNFPEFVTLDPTPEQIAAFGDQAINGAAQVAPFLDPNGPFVYQLLDFRTTNLGNTDLSGIDFNLNYFHDTGFGAMTYSLSGNYRLKSETQASKNSPWTDDLETGEPEYYLQATVGADMGNVTAKANWNYSDGYAVLPTSSLHQSKVGSFQTVDLFLLYDMPGTGWQDGLQLTLNVKNVFDRDPPVWRMDGDGGFTNGFTLGRMFQLGVRKTF